jgi:hypothetical protein
MYNFSREKIYPVLIIAAAIALAFFCRPALAATGSLTISVKTTSVSVGEEFAASITSSSDININAIGAKLDYPADLLEVKSVSGPSVITLFITKGVVSAGTAAIEGGVLPAKTLQNDKVGTITFLAKKSGNAVLTISDASGLYANDGLGTNILSPRGSLTLEIGKAPVGQNSNTSTLAVGEAWIASSSHPDQNSFYKQRTITANWNADGADGYAFVFDQIDGTIPDIANSSPQTSGEFTATGDGIWYLHVRARHDGVGGTTAEYAFNIDTTPPRPELSLSNNVMRSDGISQAVFGAVDDLSGVAGYEISIEKTGETPVYQMSASPLVIKNLPPGQYQVAVRATDRAGNMATAERALSVLSASPVNKSAFEQWQIVIYGVFVAIVVILFAKILALFGKRIKPRR